MLITKERKILIAVASLACGIFMLDRVLMGGAMSGPAQAQAAGPSVAALPPAALNPVTLRPVSDVELHFSDSASSTTSLAQRLAHAGRQLPAATPDAFRPSAQWQSTETAEQPIAAGASFNPRAFADRHPLDAVFASPQGATAMVAGQAVRRGETRDGMTLTDIGDRWVVWTGGGVRIKVHLDPVR